MTLLQQNPLMQLFNLLRKENYSLDLYPQIYNKETRYEYRITPPTNHQRGDVDQAYLVRYLITEIVTHRECEYVKVINQSNKCLTDSNICIFIPVKDILNEEDYITDYINTYLISEIELARRQPVFVLTEKNTPIPVKVFEQFRNCYFSDTFHEFTKYLRRYNYGMIFNSEILDICENEWLFYSFITYDEWDQKLKVMWSHGRELDFLTAFQEKTFRQLYQSYLLSGDYQAIPVFETADTECQFFQHAMRAVYQWIMERCQLVYNRFDANILIKTSPHENVAQSLGGGETTVNNLYTKHFINKESGSSTQQITSHRMMLTTKIETQEEDPQHVYLHVNRSRGIDNVKDHGNAISDALIIESVKSLDRQTIAKGDVYRLNKQDAWWIPFYQVDNLLEVVDYNYCRYHLNGAVNFLEANVFKMIDQVFDIHEKGQFVFLGYQHNYEEENGYHPKLRMMGLKSDLSLLDAGNEFRLTLAWKHTRTEQRLCIDFDVKGKLVLPVSVYWRYSNQHNDHIGGHEMVVADSYQLRNVLTEMLDWNLDIRPDLLNTSEEEIWTGFLTNCWEYKEGVIVNLEDCFLEAEGCVITFQVKQPVKNGYQVSFHSWKPSLLLFKHQDLSMEIIRHLQENIEDWLNE